jgi:hypothetical protein
VRILVLAVTVTTALLLAGERRPSIFVVAIVIAGAVVVSMTAVAGNVGQ